MGIKMVRLFIRPNELSSQMISAGRFQNVRQAIKKVKSGYSNLGKISVRQGIFYSEHYKQIMVEAELAALDTLAMIVVEN